MTSGKKTVIAALLAVLVSGFSQAQPAAPGTEAVARSDNKAVQISRTTVRPVIDGILDDEAWASATVITDLHQMSPVDHGTPSQDSIFYVTYDDEYFYVGARLYDDPDAITARQMTHGSSMGNDDNINVLLDTFSNGRTGFRFITNPNGVRQEGVFEGPGNYNSDWSGIWQVNSRIDDEGWTAEMAIPFTTLNFDPNSTTWGFNVNRGIARTNEEIAWSSFNRSFDPSTSGRILGISNINQGLGLDIVPSATVAFDEDHVNGSTDTRFDPSLDIFYKFTPNLTGALTINTDFSATEVDDRQVNLTRFSLFFPEKRDFFLQDSEIFRFGGMGGNDSNGIPFYSRRIGLDPQTGRPVDIDAGAKLAGRIGNTSIGTLLVQQGDRPGLSEQRVFVGRMAHTVLSESQIGAIFTHGDPNSDRDNNVAGVDFNYRNTRFSDTHTLSGDFWYQQSDTEGLNGDDKAYSLYMDMSTEGTGVGGSLGYRYVGDEYMPALGFANRRGVEHYTGRVAGNYYLMGHPWLRYLYMHLDAEQLRGIDNNELQSENITFRPVSINTHWGDRFSVDFTREREGLSTDFEIRPGIVIPTGKYAFNSYEVGLATSDRRVFSPDISYLYGDFYDGERQEVNLGLNWQPIARFAAEFSYTFTDVQLPQGDFISRLISLDASFAFTSEWSWTNLLQYDNLSESLGLNSRLHWAPQAGENLYFVINYNFDADGAFNGLESRDSEVVLKYTRNFRF